MNFLGDLYLSKAINELKRNNKGDRMVKVLFMRYWLNYTFADIAEELGLSLARVRQIEMQALSMLGRKLKKSELSDFLGATI
jgi:DNA-directed RNA polymerase sigma subunit (sigma70/sigma32)